MSVLFDDGTLTLALLYAKIQRLTCGLLCLKTVKKIKQQILQLIVTTLFWIRSSSYADLRHFPVYIREICVTKTNYVSRAFYHPCCMIQTPAVLRPNILTFTMSIYVIAATYFSVIYK